MTSRHSDPSKPRTYTVNRDDFINVEARAPYNFVSLPEKMVEAETPPHHDQYDPSLLTGWLECTLETCSPTYIRGMLTELQYREFGQSKSDELSENQKKDRARFFSSSNKHEGGFNAPVIPGSSLRGMLRSLVEVASNGRMRWVGNIPTFTFRAVAAQADDPLKDPYKSVVGNMAANVYTGYLVKDGEKWFVQPALTPKESGLNAKERFLKIDEEDISVNGFIKFNQDKYIPQVINVSFEHGQQKSKRIELQRKAERTGKKKTRLSYIVKEAGASLKFSGVLVTSGNMKETGTAKSPRFKHCIVMPKNTRAKRLEIPEQVVKDYRAGLSVYQVESLEAWRDGMHDESWGCLGNGKPVFYIPNPQNSSLVLYFGHNPNFRIPAMLKDKARASTPLDFVPEALRNNPKPDLADAIFGWVEEIEQEKDPKTGKTQKKVIGPAKQYAGRVSVGDAHYKQNKRGIWYKNSPITPKILTSPKVTTFQHYLVQDKNLRHDPDNKASLAHYGTDPKETNIRGRKFYWHKGASPAIEATDEEKKGRESQLTQIIPVKDGVSFSFRIHFENLRSEELGAICCALSLPGEVGKTYLHKIGMGKPLGMGSIRINIKEFHVTNRAEGRYEKFFDVSGWFLPENQTWSSGACIQKFEEFMRNKGVLQKDQSLGDSQQVKELLTMLQWVGEAPTPQWLDFTRYMEIEREVSSRGKKEKVNEYKERPVLPTPFGVWSKHKK